MALQIFFWRHPKQEFQDQQDHLVLLVLLIILNLIALFIRIGQRQRGLGKMETKKIRVFDFNIKNISLAVTAFIGPSGCGKSTLLRSFNRMNDEIINCNS